MSGHWRSQRERGSRGALRLIIWIALHGGRALCRCLLVPISLYFLLTAPVARRASREFLARATGRTAHWWNVFAHLFVFATTLLDRVYLVNARLDRFRIDSDNETAFWDAMRLGRGCLLLGSHLGSFELLGFAGCLEKKLVVNVVMHLDDTANVRELLLCSGRELPYRVIPLGQPESMLRVRECLERGEVVGILADRVYGNEPTEIQSFLGMPARFSLSPLRLARITGVPVVAMFGLFQGGNRYRIVFERMADRVEDAAALSRCLKSYVEILERHARAMPYNWFNFYPYWSA